KCCCQILIFRKQIYFKITYLYVFKIYATSNYALYEETLPNCFIFSSIDYLYLFPSRYWYYQSTITIGYSSLKSNLAKSYRWYFNSKNRFISFKQSHGSPRWDVGLCYWKWYNKQRVLLLEQQFVCMDIHKRS